MTPAKLSTRAGDRNSARARAAVAAKYLEAAELMATDDDDPYSINVCVGTAVLAGIAAGDAICLLATGQRYAGKDHGAAALLLERVEVQLGRRLKRLVALKPGAHYGDKLLTTRDRLNAVRDASALLANARSRML